jgi:regulatory protein
MMVLPSPALCLDRVRVETVRLRVKMMKTITALQMQKNNQERVSVFLDDEYAFSVGLMTATQLHKGQQLSPAQIEALQEVGAEDLAYQRALGYLAARPRSVAEVDSYLQGKGYLEATIQAVLERLHAHQYLDDDAFARFWIDNRNRFRPRGTPALRQELRQKGLERETIDAALDEQEDEPAAWTAAEARMGRWADLEKAEFDKKLISYLARRGFSYAVCRATCQRAWAQLHEAEE